jgi:Inorganic Pyrophosphatase
VPGAAASGGGDAERVGERVREALGRLGEVGHGGSGGGGAGHGAGHGEKKPKGEKKPAGEKKPEGHAGGGGGGGGGGAEGGGEKKPEKAPAKKPSGGGDGRARDEHGRFTSKADMEKGDAFDSPFQQAWGAPFPMPDQSTDAEHPDTPTAESEDWRRQGDGLILQAADPFLAFAENWVERKGLLDPDADYGALIGEAVVELARAFGATGQQGMGALLTRAYFNVLADDFEGKAHRTMILTPQDFERAVAALDSTEKRAAPRGAVAQRIAKVQAMLRKEGASEPRDYLGLGLEIDRPKGYVQRGVGADGTPWERIYQYDYGFIPGTAGGDGEGVDVYVGPLEDATIAYWIAQKTWGGGFDEWKVCLGFPSADRARLAFLLHTPRELLGPIFEMPVAAMLSLLGNEPMSLGREVIASMRKAEWSTVYVNDLPDSAFLYVEGGGEKDEEGKTTPRSLRHFPYKDKGGSVDPAHVKAALSRIPQADLGDDKKKELSARATKLLENTEKAMSKAAAKTVPMTKAFSTFKAGGKLDASKPSNDCRKLKKDATDVSFDDLRSLVNAALGEALPPSTDKDCSPCGYWVADLFDDYAVFSFDGALWKVGYSYGNGVVTLTGQPVQVVRTYAELSGTPGNGTQEDAMGKNASAAVKKDGEGSPGAAAPGDGGDGDGLPVSDGADIVLLAYDRLESVVDAINAAGGTLTPELRQSIDGVCALLETVAPDADDDAAGAGEDGLAAGEGAPEPMSAAAKKDEEEMDKRFVAAKRFLRKVARIVAKAKEEKDETKKSAMLAVLDKALVYGNEAFGSETSFQMASLGSAIPEFTDPSQLKPEEVAVPSTPAPRGQYAEDPNYTPNDNSQQAYAAGSPQIAEKIAKLKKRLGDLRGTAEPIAKNNASGVHAEWSPTYLASLPDSHFLKVEAGVNKDAAGRSQLLVGPGSGFRHFAVRDHAGALSLGQIQKALRDIPLAGLEPTVKAALTAQAQDLLKEAEAEAGSSLSKGARGDDGWPMDLNDQRFRAGKSRAVPEFGFDGLQGKHDKAVAAAGPKKAPAKLGKVEGAEGWRSDMNDGRK